MSLRQQLPVSQLKHFIPRETWPMVFLTYGNSVASILHALG